MRFLVIGKATKNSEAGVMGDEKAFEAMAKYNEELAKAGVLLDVGGLQPSSAGKRVVFDGPKRTVVDGPFPETKELIAGFMILQTKTLEECVEWVKRSPTMSSEPCSVEIRPFFEWADPSMSDEARAPGGCIHELLPKKG
jgi:hypothetical protein